MTPDEPLTRAAEAGDWSAKVDGYAAKGGIVSVGERTGFEIGPVTAAEVDQLAGLVLVLGREIRSDPTWDGIDREHVSRRAAELVASPDHLLIGARHSSALVGYAWAHDLGAGLLATWSVAYLNELVVEPSWRCRGAGRGLFEAVRAWAHSRGAIRFMEWQGSHAATAFYERLGLKGSLQAEASEPPHYELRIS